ncbi:O-antigen ligase family protein [Bizionia myxarmorum]|uniref:O-antigen ligase family protein n=1 Tax=Bizionia myxarmorum TaxID=291186 RepID=UPI0014787D41|nr:O-antigen ligase family protein [Bizionia myxarmorum]
MKWTILYVIFMMLFGLLHISYAITEFVKETLPLLLFLLVVLTNGENKINYLYLLRFFRYTFVGCLIIYLSPYFYNQIHYLFSNGVIFKESSYVVVRVGRSIPRNTGFVFDFRIMAQLACLYLLLLYYFNKTKNYWDVALLVTVAITTFSRGPLIILVFLLIAVYLPKKIRITKRVLVIGFSSFVFIIIGVVYVMNNDNLQKFVSTFNPFQDKNAFSQRGALIDYSLNKFYENPLGNGIGALSSPNADNVIYAGITNLHKEIPDKIYYYRVTDAYIGMSLAEKGIFGFILFALSFVEIFYSNRNRVSLFFLIGLILNLIGTDIPKQGFYYFAIILIYYGLSQLYSTQVSVKK